MNDFHFIRPLWLVAFLPLVFLVWRLWRAQGLSAQAGKIIAPHLLEALVVTPAGQSRFRPVVTLFVIWALSVFALAGPSWERQPNPLTEDEAALYVLLEVSGSMLASDVSPSRLERAKHKLSDLLELRKGSPTGLIVYAGSAHLVMPPTTDGRIIMQMVEELTPEMMPSEGSSVEQALQLADRMFERAGNTGSVVIFSDGIENGNFAKELGFPVNVLAFGQLTVSDQRAVVSLTVDDEDVQQISRRAAKTLSVTSDDTGGVRWQDGGIYLLPLMLILSLLPFRKGWVVG